MALLYFLAIHRRLRSASVAVLLRLQSPIVTSLIFPRPQVPSSTKNFSPGGCPIGGSCLRTSTALHTPYVARSRAGAINERMRDFISSSLSKRQSDREVLVLNGRSFNPEDATSLRWLRWEKRWQRPVQRRVVAIWSARLTNFRSAQPARNHGRTSERTSANGMARPCSAA